MKRRILSIFMCLAMVLAIVPMGVLAEGNGVSYIERFWYGGKVVDTQKDCEDYIVVDENTTTFENGKWYVVNSNVTNNNRIEVKGVANLILCNGCTLTMGNGGALKTREAMS